MSHVEASALTRSAEGHPPVALVATDRLRRSAWTAGAVLVGAMLALELGATLATPVDERIPVSWFRVLSLPLLSGYALITTCGMVAAARRSIVALEPVLRLDAGGREALAHRLCRLSRRERLLCVAVGVGLPVVVGASLPDLRSAVFAGHPQTLAFWAMASLFWWLAAQGVALLLAQGRAFRDLGRNAVRVDLLRPGALAPFGRFAVQSALFVCGALALAVLLAVTPGAQSSWLPRLEIARGVGALGTIFAASAACALVALALPLLGVRESIRKEKQRVLDRVEGALPRQGAEDVLAEAATQRAVGLLALRDRIQGVAEWPLDAITRRRFGLYALLPVTSWLAKVLLERGVEWMVGLG